MAVDLREDPSATLGGYTETIVNISSAQILAMGTIPIELLPAAGVGKYYEWYAVIEYNYGTTQYDGIGTTELAISFGGDSVMIPSWFITTFTQDAYVKVYESPAFLADNNTSYVVPSPRTLNTNITLSTADSSDPTLGDGTLRVKIYHKTITFGA